MKISNLFIGIVVLAMVTLGMTGMWLDTASTYGVVEPINNLSIMKKTITNMNSTLKSWSTQFKNDQASANAYYPVLAPITAMSNLWSITTLLPDIVTDIVSLGGENAGFIPDWFIAGMLVIVAMIVIFGVMAYAQRYSP